MSLSNIYANAIKSELRYFSIWEPGLQLELGDFGYLDDNIFQRKGNLKELGIEIKERTSDRISHHTLNSQDSMNVEFGTGADISGAVKASVKIIFTKENAVFFNASGCTSKSIENGDSVGKALIQLHGRGEWEKSLVVIMERVIAKRAQVVISKTSGSEIEFEAESPKIAKIDLADARAKLKLKSEKNIGYKFIGEDCTVLQSLWRVKVRIFKSNEFMPAKSGDNEVSHESVEKEYQFEELSPLLAD